MAYTTRRTPACCWCLATPYKPLIVIGTCSWCACTASSVTASDLFCTPSFLYRARTFPCITSLILFFHRLSCFLFRATTIPSESEIELCKFSQFILFLFRLATTPLFNFNFTFNFLTLFAILLGQQQFHKKGKPSKLPSANGS